MSQQNEQKNSEEPKQSADTLDTIEVKMGKVDRILDKTKAILKKHWGIILLILLCLFIYWAFNLPEVKEEQPEQTEQTQYEEQYYDTTNYDTENATETTDIKE